MSNSQDKKEKVSLFFWTAKIKVPTSSLLGTSMKSKSSIRIKQTLQESGDKNWDIEVIVEPWNQWTVHIEFPDLWNNKIPLPSSHWASISCVFSLFAAQSLLEQKCKNGLTQKESLFFHPSSTFTFRCSQTRTYASNPVEYPKAT